MKKTFKKTLKKICIILIFIQLLFSFSNFTKATNSIETNFEDIVTTSLDNTILPIIENDAPLVQNNQYIAESEDTIIDYNVSGDVYIICNGKVTISSNIYGNVFILAKEIVISETGYITSLYSLSEKLIINGSVDTSVYSLCETFIQNNKSTIWRDLFVTAQTIELNGIIERNVNISAENIELFESASINGNFNYTSKEEAIISEGAIIYGENNFTLKNDDTDNELSYSIKDSIIDFIESTLKYIVITLAIFFVLKWLAPKAIETSSNLFKNEVRTIALNSCFILFLTPIIAIALLFTKIATSLSFIIIILYILLLLLCTKFTIIAISQIIKDKMPNWKCNDTLKQVLIICGLSIIYKLLKPIPIFSIVLNFAIIFFGIGIIISLIVPKKDKKTKNQQIENQIEIDMNK